MIILEMSSFLPSSGYTAYAVVQIYSSQQLGAAVYYSGVKWGVICFKSQIYYSVPLYQ